MPQWNVDADHNRNPVLDQTKKQNLSVLDWIVIYTAAAFVIQILIDAQIYPSKWLASLLPGGVHEINLMFVHEILQCGLFVGGVLLFLRRRKTTIASIGWVPPKKPQDYLYAVIFGVATCSLMIFVSSILTALFPQWATTQDVINTTLQVECSWDVFAAFLSVAVMAPICEELLFRGYLYHAVCAKFQAKTAIMITSFVFALVHGQWFQLLPLFLAGVFLNLFYVRTQSLIATVLMHSAWNTFSLFLVICMDIVV